jgi:hypothetical protein
MFNRSSVGVIVMAWCVTASGSAIQAHGSIIETGDVWVATPQDGPVPAKAGGPVTVDPATGLAIAVETVREGGVRVAANGHGLDVQKVVARDGSYRLTIRGGGDSLTVEGATSDVLLQRGGDSVRLTPAASDRAAFARAATLLSGSAALGMFRAAVARMTPSTRETVGGLALEIADVLLRVIQDDPGAVSRFRQTLVSRDSGVVRVAFLRRPCYADWEAEVLDAWGAYEACYNDFSWWSGGREGCALLYTLRVEAAWFEFLACISIRIV